MYNVHDEEYKKLCRRILSEGVSKDDRTGVGTISIFGDQMRFKMSEGFPMLTLRKIHTKSLVHELLWFLGSYEEKYSQFGNTNIRYLLDHSVRFWTEWPYEFYKKNMVEDYLEDDLKTPKKIKKLSFLGISEYEDQIKNDDNFALQWGELGPVYGKNWLNFGGYKEKMEISKEYEANRNGVRIVDFQEWKEINIKGINQIDNIIEQLQENPDSRRILVTAWNPSDVEEALLPPCHILFQFYTRKLTSEEQIKYQNYYPGLETPQRSLSMKFYMRSNDVYLGNPFNIASYALLLHMVAQVVNMIPDELIYSGGDIHLYNNSIEATKEIIERESFNPCQLRLNPEIKNIYNFRESDIIFENYQSHPNIKVEVAV